MGLAGVKIGMFQLIRRMVLNILPSATAPASYELIVYLHKCAQHAVRNIIFTAHQWCIDYLLYLFDVESI
jgi:hypothetical protein